MKISSCSSPSIFLPFALCLPVPSSPSAISHALLMRQMSQSFKELYQKYFLTLTHTLLLSFAHHLFPGSQSSEHAFCIMRRAKESSAKKQSICLQHTRSLGGIVFIIEQSALNARHLSQKRDPAASVEI